MPGPLFKLRLRLKLRDELEGQGFTRRQIRNRLDELDDDVIERATAQVGATEAIFALENGVGAIGDGEFLKKILDFFKSDLGQALIKLILGFLI